MQTAADKQTVGLTNSTDRYRNTLSGRACKAHKILIIFGTLLYLQEIQYEHNLASYEEPEDWTLINRRAYHNMIVRFSYQQATDDRTPLNLKIKITNFENFKKKI